MIVDTNILVYAIDRGSPEHKVAVDWLTDQLNGDERIGLPWTCLMGFMRIVTHPRVMARPEKPADAWRFVKSWLERDVVWTPVPTEHHDAVLDGLMSRYHIAGNLVPDADIAALAIEHGQTIASNDTDFARFVEVRWINPLAPAV